MHEEDKIRLLADELKKEQSIKFKDIPIKLSVNPKEGYVRGDWGNQNIKLIRPKEERGASAILEKQLELNDNLKAYLTRELRKGGDEATGIQLKNSNFNIGGSTDHNKEQRANFSGQANTPLGNIEMNLNTNFAKNKNGEIFWRSPDGKWNASGSTNFDDFTQANIGYNTDKFNIDLDMDSMGNENLRGQWNPTPYTSIGGSTNFGKDQNIYAGVNYPINKNWVAEALYHHTANRDEDDNYWGVGLRGNF